MGTKLKLDLDGNTTTIWSALEALIHQMKLMENNSGTTDGKKVQSFVTDYTEKLMEL